jgi:hypothetical protein
MADLFPMGHPFTDPFMPEADTRSLYDDCHIYWNMTSLENNLVNSVLRMEDFYANHIDDIDCRSDFIRARSASTPPAIP